MLEKPQLVSVEQVASGWINKYLLTYVLPNGKRYTYESASRKDYQHYCIALEAYANNTAVTPDAICVIPITANNELVLIREFRYPLNSWCIAFPAGLMEQGEPIELCVSRKLSEETGYALVPETSLEVLPQAGFSSTGMTDETVQVVLAQVEKAGSAHTEENEMIEVFTLPIEKIPAFLAENTTAIGTRCQLGLMYIYARYSLQ